MTLAQRLADLDRYASTAEARAASYRTNHNHAAAHVCEAWAALCRSQARRIRERTEEIPCEPSPRDAAPPADSIPQQRSLELDG